MKRIKLTVAYDGTNYCGWQLQKNGVTIEQRLNEAITQLTGEPVRVIGASRTDSGVHAMGNVAVFDTDTRIPPEKLAYALNGRLPEDIRIQSSEEVPRNFHPRKANCVKTYEYRIWNHRFENPVKRLYDYFVFLPLDAEKMREAAACLVGEHDFRSFASSGSEAEETVRRIYGLEVLKEGCEILLRVRGDGFLYNMVRIIAGTLIQAGIGAFPPSHVKEILDARDRQAAPQTAPAKGLTLVEIAYEKALQDCLTVQEQEWSYGIWQKEILLSGESVIYIHYCEDKDFERTMKRLIKKTMRDGARKVWICDRSGRLKEWGGEEDRAEKDQLETETPEEKQLGKEYRNIFLRAVDRKDIPPILETGIFKPYFPDSSPKDLKWFCCEMPESLMPQSKGNVAADTESLKKQGKYKENL